MAHPTRRDGERAVLGTSDGAYRVREGNWRERHDMPRRRLTMPRSRTTERRPAHDIAEKARRLDMSFEEAGSMTAIGNAGTERAPMPAHLAQLRAESVLVPRRERIVTRRHGVRVANATIGPVDDDLATTGVVGHAAGGVLGLLLRPVKPAGTTGAFALDRPAVVPGDDMPVVPAHCQNLRPWHNRAGSLARDMRAIGRTRGRPESNRVLVACSDSTRVSKSPQPHASAVNPGAAAT
jgi:hypothetical protein